MTFNWNYNHKCGKSAKGYPVRPETNETRCLQHCQTVVWNVKANSVRWAQQEAHCSKICAKADEQWSKGIMHCCLHWVENGPKFTSNINTGDESGVSGYNPETKQQPSQWKTPTSWPKKAQVRNNAQINVDLFFDTEVIVHKEFDPPRQTSTEKFYCDGLRQ